MRLFFISLITLMIALPVQAEVTTPYSGTQTIETAQPFDAYINNLTAAIKAHKMGVVATACATCGAKSIGMTIPGNQVIMIFNPHFAVRMLKASKSAGVEAPLRLYITENPDGKAHLSYRLPSHVFKPYDVPALNDMAKELDAIIENIISTSLK